MRTERSTHIYTLLCCSRYIRKHMYTCIACIMLCYHGVYVVMYTYEHTQCRVYSTLSNTPLLLRRPYSAEVITCTQYIPQIIGTASPVLHNIVIIIFLYVRICIVFRFSSVETHYTAKTAL